MSVNTAERRTEKGLDLLSGSQVEFGTTDVGWLPAGAVTDLRQVRETYDRDELQLLADRIPYEILPSGVVHFKLQNPPVINAFTDRQALQRYIDDYSEYYEGEVPEIDIDQLPIVDGAWHIRINGHRRGRAFKLKCQQLGLDEANSIISYSFRRGIPFAEAIQEQLVENTSAPISPEQDARAIARHKKWLMVKGMNSSNSAIAEFFGYGEKKVADALRFVTMPDDITRFLDNGLTYGNIVNLARLRDAYLEAERRIPSGRSFAELMLDDDIQQAAPAQSLAEQKTKDYFETMLLGRFTDLSTARINEMIKAKIAEVTKQSSYLNGELFVIDEIATRRDARSRVRRELTGMAIRLLHYLGDQEDLDLKLKPEDVALLRHLHERAISQDDETQPVMFA